MRIATFNVENLDEDKMGKDGKVIRPTVEERTAYLRPQLLRLNADILCLQEVHGQEEEGEPRSLRTLKELLVGTMYESYELAYTKTTADEAYDVRNLVVLSRFPIQSMAQIRNDLVPDLLYRPVTAIPPEESAKKISWQRPILHAVIDVHGIIVHVVNLHLKSKIPSTVAGQKDGYQYNSVNGWAEGFFISSMKRVGQALETRMLVDQILNDDENANIVVCGDFNAEPAEVPVEAIVGRVENTGNPDLGFRQLLPCSNTIPKDNRFTHIHEGQGNLLDHMVISRSMMSRYESAEIHNEGLHDESISFATDGKYPESDHAPFVAQFNVPLVA